MKEQSVIPHWPKPIKLLKAFQTYVLCKLSFFSLQSNVTIRLNTGDAVAFIEY